jgi:hypothetical protein
LREILAANPGSSPASMRSISSSVGQSHRHSRPDLRHRADATARKRECLCPRELSSAIERWLPRCSVPRPRGRAAEVRALLPVADSGPVTGSVL